MLDFYKKTKRKNILFWIFLILFIPQIVGAPPFDAPSAKILIDKYKTNLPWQATSSGAASAAKAVYILNSIVAQYSGTLETSNPDIKVALDRARLLIANYNQAANDSITFQSELPAIQAAYDAYALYFSNNLVTSIGSASTELSNATTALTASVESLIADKKNIQDLFKNPPLGVVTPSFVTL